MRNKGVASIPQGLRAGQAFDESGEPTYGIYQMTHPGLHGASNFGMAGVENLPVIGPGGGKVRGPDDRNLQRPAKTPGIDGLLQGFNFHDMAQDIDYAIDELALPNRSVEELDSP